MSEEQKSLHLQDFRDAGFLQEVNRQFFHPLGLALSVVMDKESGLVKKLGPIFDYRDDADGMRFGEDQFDPDFQSKADAIAALRASKIEARRSVGCDENGIQLIPPSEEHGEP